MFIWVKAPGTESCLMTEVDMANMRSWPAGTNLTPPVAELQQSLNRKLREFVQRGNVSLYANKWLGLSDEPRSTRMSSFTCQSSDLPKVHLLCAPTPTQPLTATNPPLTTTSLFLFITVICVDYKPLDSTAYVVYSSCVLSEAVSGTGFSDHSFFNKKSQQQL